MKSQIILLLVFLSTSIGFSQIGPNDDAVYLDSLNNISNEKNFKFIRVIKDFKDQKDLYDVVFYSRSGKVERQAKTSNKFEMVFEGPCVYYYENGNRRRIETYFEKKINGKQFEWYENGKPKLESEVIIDKETNNSTTKIIHYWNANNEQKVIDGFGDYEEISGPYFASGKIKNGFKDGKWEGYDFKIGYTFSENYENQKLLSGVSIDSDKVSRTYTMVEVKPEPKNGLKDFYKHVAKNFRVPEKYGLNGRILVGFNVDKNGEVIDPKILVSMGFGTDEEAIKIVTTYKNFAPGEIRGIKVKYAFTLPIAIQSQN
jgi:antitoxin component YwqK of YwqJK toxin-antitoxin module